MYFHHIFNIFCANSHKYEPKVVISCAGGQIVMRLKEFETAPCVNDHYCCCECDLCEGAFARGPNGELVGCLPKMEDLEIKYTSAPKVDELLSAIFYAYLQARSNIFEKGHFSNRSKWLVAEAKRILSNFMVLPKFSPLLYGTLFPYITMDDIRVYRQYFPYDVVSTSHGKRLRNLMSNKEKYYLKELIKVYLSQFPLELLRLILSY